MKTSIKILYKDEIISEVEKDNSYNPEEVQIQFSNGREIIWGRVQDLIEESRYEDRCGFD